jgi:hypothetical protein
MLQDFPQATDVTMRKPSDLGSQAEIPMVFSGIHQMLANKAPLGRVT